MRITRNRLRQIIKEEIDTHVSGRNIITEMFSGSMPIKLMAPIDGKVEEIHAQLGRQVYPGQEMMTFVDEDGNRASLFATAGKYDPEGGRMAHDIQVRQGQQVKKGEWVMSLVDDIPLRLRHQTSKEQLVYPPGNQARTVDPMVTDPNVPTRKQTR